MIMASVLKIFGDFGSTASRTVICRLYGSKVKRRPLPIGNKIKATNESLACRGFLRQQRAYDPPANLSDKLSNIFTKAGISSNSNQSIDDPAVRFHILNDCFKEFNHGVPNSILNNIETVGDIEKFYATPVNSTVPLDAMKTMDLPQNLHIQYDYHRFHPDNDTMFNGITAFTKSSTLVTGLKYKKKYPGHKQKTSWV